MLWLCYKLLTYRDVFPFDLCLTDDSALGKVWVFVFICFFFFIKQGWWKVCTRLEQKAFYCWNDSSLSCLLPPRPLPYTCVPVHRKSSGNGCEATFLWLGYISLGACSPVGHWTARPNSLLLGTNGHFWLLMRKGRHSSRTTLSKLIYFIRGSLRFFS